MDAGLLLAVLMCDSVSSAVYPSMSVSVQRRSAGVREHVCVERASERGREGARLRLRLTLL